MGSISCAKCGRELSPVEASSPCPVCGGLDRSVAAADEAHGVEGVVLDVDLTAQPRSWTDQWARVQRWHARLRAASEGRIHDVASANYEDEMYAFFESCHHLKEWLKNDPAKPLTRPQDVEDLIDTVDALRWCADIANGSKHLIADRWPRVDPKTGVAHRRFAMELGDPPSVSVQYTIAGAGQVWNALQLQTNVSPLGRGSCAIGCCSLSDQLRARSGRCAECLAAPFCGSSGFLRS